jgi:hypothetical protein
MKNTILLAIVMAGITSAIQANPNGWQGTGYQANYGNYNRCGGYGGGGYNYGGGCGYGNYSSTQTAVTLNGIANIISAVMPQPVAPVPAPYPMPYYGSAYYGWYGVPVTPMTANGFYRCYPH